MPTLYTVNTQETDLKIDETKWENINQTTHKTMTGALSIVGEWVESWGFVLTDPKNEILSANPQTGINEYAINNLITIGDAYVPGTKIVFVSIDDQEEKILEADEHGTLIPTPSQS